MKRRALQHSAHHTARVGVRMHVYVYTLFSYKQACEDISSAPHTFKGLFEYCVRVQMCDWAVMYGVSPLMPVDTSRLSCQDNERLVVLSEAETLQTIRLCHTHTEVAAVTPLPSDSKPVSLNSP